MGRLASFLAALLLALVPAAPALAAKVADIANTKHNLSKTGPGTVKASSETQICVFCHTPHGAENVVGAPLWNRKLSGATYSTYSSSSIEASVDELSKGPGGLSRLCLSCHDGTLAIGNVNVLAGQANASIAMTGTTPDGKMPPGAGATTGYTRLLGTDLSNDHPISFTYDAKLALDDGELRTPDGALVGTRVRGAPKPKLPLEAGPSGTGQVQCTTCHDPHLKETDPTKGTGKFLRLNRLQEATTIGSGFSESGDIFCLACHEKAGQTWALSAHANAQVADEKFADAAATEREFPLALPVWRAACLSCHDTHTVQGARRLLREGTDSTSKPKSGGTSAIEETCYQCHSSSADTILQANTSVPNIKDDFGPGNIHMPIKSTEQQTGGEVHDIGTGTGLAQRGKDFYEDPKLLGKQGNLQNRHVECTDCHNPHRVIKNRLFNANAAVPDAGGTHDHNAARHTNIASGVLKGSYGVEPTAYADSLFGTPAGGYDVKRGDGGTDPDTSVTKPWVTREYQVCLKCHSSYAFDTAPTLGDSKGGTPAGSANGLTTFTDQAMEFRAPTSPVSHKGQTTAGTPDSGAFKGNPPGQTYSVDYQAANHRAWHPVMDDTGRDITARGMTSSPWLAPWTSNVGSQTMYCTDCHGSQTGANTVVPNAGRPWGPHGSANPFILKGSWTRNSGTADRTTLLCLKCHDTNVYSSTGTSNTRNTGFYNSSRGNLHNYHANKISGGVRCTWCHVAVPHGWKNRSFLVNLNDVGPEAGRAPGTQVRLNTTAPFEAPPYYVRSVLKIRSFGSPGNWVEGNCGSAGAPGNGQSGRSWMRDSSENCANAP